MYRFLLAICVFTFLQLEYVDSPFSVIDTIKESEAAYPISID
jgi:hypothetical protein